jgi:transposase
MGRQAATSTLSSCVISAPGSKPHARRSCGRCVRAGAALEVDYAGMTLLVVDMGMPREAQIFVACLPSSQLIYAEAGWTQGHEDWLGAHVRALAWIGGCPEMLIPDNLKSGVTEACYHDPVVNRSYHKLARHYGMAVVPARVRRPRDKSSVESSVNQVERWVLAPLRNRQLFSLDEANVAILERVEAFNNRPFSPPRLGSRRSLFETIERAALKPLPVAAFVIGQWLAARVNTVYHIVVDQHYYSVPYRMLQSKVDVFLSATAVSVFSKGERVASHARSFRPAEHTTLSSPGRRARCSTGSRCSAAPSPRLNFRPARDPARISPNSLITTAVSAMSG